MNVEVAKVLRQTLEKAEHNCGDPDVVHLLRDALDLLDDEPAAAPARVLCAECKHWNEGGSRRGQCRRKPPVVLYGVDVPLWPETEPGMWCGESVKR